MFPKVEFPVSRGTPMMSPAIKWDHSEDWGFINFDTQVNQQSAERKVEISLADPDFEFIKGHSIDGMNIISNVS